MKTYKVITVFPEMVKDFTRYGVLSQAIKSGLIHVDAINPRDFTEDVHKTVDDRPFGGGDGMIMLVEPLEKAIKSLQANKSTDQKIRVIYLSPQGKKFSDQMARDLSKEEDIVFICGRYGGIDQRFINTYVTEEVSVGDYVLSGGELGAFVMIDAISRMVPGVLGHKDSADEDSFAQGLLEHPNFTRPREILGQSVPEVLFSGHHKVIAEWKRMTSLLVTIKKRPDLLNSKTGKSLLSAEDKKKLIIFFNSLSESDKKSCGLNDFVLEL
ncbi:MAG: tRNA (guanine-N(1)-)-methyltransferase [Oligoflexia bacterium]|nr:MAG: tRNA (guanine-N(1)-)-methyltransferase [Oligoflexia bacterium]